jgi:flagellar motor switch protein FliN/FliY
MIDPSNDPKQDNEALDTGDDDWAAAMAEQAAHTRHPTQADGLAAADDDWAAALAEQTAAQTSANAKVGTGASAGSAASSTAAPTGQPVSAAHMFAPLVASAAAGDSDIDMIMDIPVQLSVELGRTRLTIKNILQLGQGSVVELDGLAGEPMDIFVNGYLIAQGEVVVVDEKYGIRVTDIITASDRINRLNSRR